MHWHPREHGKALNAMQSLTLEERGAYNTCLDLIYDREGPIPDDARWLAGWMGVSLRKWAIIRASLLVKRKLYALSLNGVDCLMNERAAIELENQAKLQRKLSESGAKGGRNRAENDKKDNKNNGAAQAPLEAPPQASLKLIDKDIDSSSVASPDGEPTGGQPPKVDLDARAWGDAKALLVAKGGMSLDAAGKFFGKLLATYRLEARDLLGAIAEAEANGTNDPQGYLTKAAQARNRRRESTGPPLGATGRPRYGSHV